MLHFIQRYTRLKHPSNQSTQRRVREPRDCASTRSVRTGPPDSLVIKYALRPSSSYMSNRQQIFASLKEKRTQSEFWVNGLLYACLGIAFLPITLWVAASANEQSRILNALLVLAMAIFLLVLYNRIKVEAPLTLNKSARITLLASYALLSLCIISRQTIPPSSEVLYLISSLIAVPAYCFGIASVVLFIFGQGLRRITYTATGTFCAFILLSILMTPLDWPLRTLAGKWSGMALSAARQDRRTRRARQHATTPSQLILMVNEHPFHVASECNGFGVILTSLLLAVLLAIYRRLGPIDTRPQSTLRHHSRLSI